MASLTYSTESLKDLLLHKKIARIIESNQIERLLEALKIELSAPCKGKRLILVPHIAYKHLIIESLPLFCLIDIQVLKFYDPLLLFKIGEEKAHLFHQYFLFGQESLQEWLSNEGEDQKTFIDWEKPSIDLGFEEIHLFHPLHLPLLFQQALLKLELEMPIVTYLHLPSPLFLHDLVSEKKMRFQRNSTIDRENQLLANLIPFRLPLIAHFQDHPLLIEAFEEPTEASFLASLQQQIFSFSLQKNPLDDTLTLLQADSLLEECKKVLRYIIEIFQQDSTLRPKDLCLIATDLSLYVPYLELTLSPLFSLNFEKVPLERFQPDRIVIKKAFDLLDSSWGKEEIKYLFGSEELNPWIDRAKIREDNLFFALEKLLLGAIMSQDCPLDSPYAPPFEVPLSLIEPLVELLKKLKRLQELKTQFAEGLYTFLEWSKLIETFLTTALDLSKESTFYEDLKGYFPLEELGPFDYAKLKLLLTHYFERQKGPLITGSDEAIECIQFDLGAIVPKKVLIVMGMGLDTFPKKTTLSSSYALKIKPPHSQIDRYCFLESLLLAKERLCFSYTGKYPSTLIEELRTYAILE